MEAGSGSWSQHHHPDDEYELPLASTSTCGPLTSHLTASCASSGQRSKSTRGTYYAVPPTLFLGQYYALSRTFWDPIPHDYNTFGWLNCSFPESVQVSPSVVVLPL